MPPQDAEILLVSLGSVNPRFDFTNGTKISVMNLMNTTIHTHSSLRILGLLLLPVPFFKPYFGFVPLIPLSA